MNEPAAKARRCVYVPVDETDYQLFIAAAAAEDRSLAAWYKRNTIHLARQVALDQVKEREDAK